MMFLKFFVFISIAVLQVFGQLTLSIPNMSPIETLNPSSWFYPFQILGADAIKQYYLGAQNAQNALYQQLTGNRAPQLGSALQRPQQFSGQPSGALSNSQSGQPSGQSGFLTGQQSELLNQPTGQQSILPTGQSGGQQAVPEASQQTGQQAPQALSPTTAQQTGQQAFQASTSTGQQTGQAAQPLTLPTAQQSALSPGRLG